MVDDPVGVEVGDHVGEDLVLVEHGVHGIADGDQCSLGEAGQRVGEVVFKATVGSARREPEVCRVDEGGIPLTEQFVESAEDRVAGHTYEQQPVLLLDRLADSVGGLVLHLLYETFEVAGACLRSPEAVGNPEEDGAIGDGVEEGRPGAVELQYPIPAAAHRVGVSQDLTEPVDVELLAGHLLAEADQLGQLDLDVPAVGFEVGGSLPGLSTRLAGAGNVDREGGRFVHALPDLGPLDVGVACVREHREAGWRYLAHRMLTAAQLHGHVGLDVAADVR